MIETKMAQFGTTNMAAYLRKMAIDGYVVKLDLPELRELVTLLRYSSNNLNQLTRRAHETGRIYEADLEDIQQSQERIWTAAEKIVSSLAALKEVEGAAATPPPLAHIKAKAPTQNSIRASTVPDCFHQTAARQKSCSGRSPIPDKARG